MARTAAQTTAGMGEGEMAEIAALMGVALRDRTERDVLIHGSASLVHALITEGLFDELRLMVFPLLVGPGGRESAFEAVADADLSFLAHRVLDNRILLSEYAPTGRPIPHLPGGD